MTDQINRTLYADTLETAYAHFNATLFEGALPECVLTAHPRKRSAGHFANKRWANGKAGGIDEINLNPTLFRDQGEREVLATLVHEMVHCLQEHTGKPSRNGYHNREWVGMMQAIGLEPVSLDGRNGTGQKVTHTIVEGGRYAAAYEALAGRDDWQGLAFNRIDEAATGGKAEGDEDKGGTQGKRPGGRVKYASRCRTVSVWGKPGLMLAAHVNGEFVPLFQQ